MRRTNPVLGSVLVMLAALANITMIYVVGVMLRGDEGIKLVLGGVAYDISYGTIFGGLFPATIAFNFLSAIHRPGNWFARWVLDFVPSLALLLSTAIYVALSVIAVFTATPTAPSLPLLALLGFVFAWSLFDVFYNQRKNLNDLLKGEFAGNGAFGGRSGSAAAGSGSAPDQTLRLKSRTGKPELSIRPTVLIEDPIYVVRRGDGFEEVSPDNILARIAMRGDAFFDDPQSVPVEVADVEYRVIDRKPADEARADEPEAARTEP